MKTNKDPLVEEVLQSRPDNLARLLGAHQDGELTDRQNLRMARASCCNALYPIVSPREPPRPAHELEQEINLWREQIRQGEEEILNLDLQHKQGLVSDEVAIATKIKKLAAQVAACKLQVQQCASRIEDEALLPLRDGPSLLGR